MYVLMDMEWYASQSTVFITQIAAIRIDSNFEIVNTFSKLVFPRTLKGIQWKHMAFSGAAPGEFLRGDTVEKVFESLRRWLAPSDVLLWWHESSQAFFRKAFAQVTGEEIAHDMWILRPGVRNVLQDGRKNKGSPHELCKARALDATWPEHRSLNDVRAMRILLRWANQPISHLIDPAYQSLEFTVKPPVLSPEEDAAGASASSKEGYVLDRKTGIVHRADCIYIDADWEDCRPIPFNTCTQLGLKTCSCCKSTVHAVAHRKDNHDQPVCVAGSTRSSRHIVHYVHCRILSRIPADRQKRFDHMGKAQEAGYHLCKYCAAIDRFYKPVMEQAQTYCHETGLTCVLNHGVLHIHSKHDFWRIAVEEVSGKPALYHRNRMHRRRATKEVPIDDYHRQLSQSHKVLALLRQIADHDQYVDKQETLTQQKEQEKKNVPGCTPPARHSKKGRKLARKEKKQKQRSQIARTLAIIDELEALHQGK